MRQVQRFLVWIGVATAIVVPIAAAAVSPLLAWRESIYIAAGFAGILALCLLLLQPLLAGGFLPGLTLPRSRSVHRWIGGALVLAVIAHVIGLWITSPPDVIDVLLFRSPTPFSHWGVIAMWAVFAAALLAAFRRRIQVKPKTWRLFHTSLVLVIVCSTVVHALLIEGAMEPVTKTVLCILVGLATLKTIKDLRVLTLLRRRRI